MSVREPPDPRPRRAHFYPLGHPLEHLGPALRPPTHSQCPPLAKARCRAFLPQPGPLQRAGCDWVGEKSGLHPLGDCKRRALAKANLRRPCEQQRV
eukprot:2845900-Amphidinium_carterae.1